MADRPILFSAPMVRALLAGTKTQTRRTLNPQPVQNSAGLWTWQRPRVSVQGEGLELALAQRISIDDRLYVREHWRTVGMGSAFDGVPPRDFQPQEVWYVADGEAPGNEFAGKFRQGMHMPRWASRLTLTVTDVRVERLQDCRENDALSEGVVQGRTSFDYDVGAVEQDWFTVPGVDDPGTGVSAVDMYAQLWNIINGAGAWEANPWVAAYSFTVERGNIDQPAARE